MPVYLWELGLGLAGLCLLVGVSGLAFAAALSPWQHLSRRRPLAALVGWTFALELLLVVLVAAAALALGAGTVSPEAISPGDGPAAPADGSSSSLALAVALVVGLANGAYNAFYWTTQRALFAALGSERDSGRRYGNLQIVVAAFLKIGILVGGLLIDADGVHWILLLSAVVGLLAARALAADAGREPLHEEPPVSWRQSLAFRDRSGSAGVFRIDGLFLYLESHFWTLSLFLLVREDHSRLGVVVVVLGIAFALLFLLIKNRIDRPDAADAVYRASVALYALSWLLRLAVDETASAGTTVALLVGVTFCSSLFRLAFNKRFFDRAPRGVLARSPAGGERDGRASDAGTVGYLVAKSHVSQLVMGGVFVPLALSLHALDVTTDTFLALLYGVAAPLSLCYLFYRRPERR